MRKVNPIPDNSSVLIPMLICSDVSSEVEFCKTVFGAAELSSRPGPDGSKAHSLLIINGAMIIIEAQWPTLASRPPQSDASSPVVIFIYVEDVDTVAERAINNGATSLLPLTNQFWGDRTARMMDPAGHVWTIASRIEEATAPEREKRWSEILKTKNRKQHQ
jgi:PhnB protein